MTSAEKTLWEKLQAFQLDQPHVDFKFSDRLARENGWSLSYSKRVIEEYKRFIFLCCVTETGVTPSDAVDQAWHLHLTYTRSYWIELCKNVLGKEIHHNPTKGGGAEASKFNNYYTSTHMLYQEKFGVEPPADIWFNNKTRFSDINFQRVNLGKYWLIKKPVISTKWLVVPVIISSFFFIHAKSFNLVALIVIAVLIVCFLVMIIKNKREGNTGNSGCAMAGCSPSPHGRSATDHSSRDYSTGQEGDAAGSYDTTTPSDSTDTSSSGCGSGCSSSGCSSGCSGCGGGD